MPVTPPLPRRASHRTRALLAALAALAGACELGDRPRRPGPRELPEGALDAGAAFEGDGGALPIPRESNPAIEQAAPVEQGSTQCPGVRLWRVDRRHTGAPPGGQTLPPRFYGRDEQGRRLSLHDVLACELRMQHWVVKAHPEGTNLILWRGPYIFEPDSECDWREPVRTEPIPGGRRLYLHERCRRRARPGPAERTVVVEVRSDYTAITAR